jgi:hypothetical protein
MKRLELIANQSVRDELIEALEGRLPTIEYTIVPVVHGRGARKRKEGTRTWPETNFMLVSYLGEDESGEVASAITEVSRRFADEGIYAALSEASPIL